MCVDTRTYIYIYIVISNKVKSSHLELIILPTTRKRFKKFQIYFMKSMKFNSDFDMNLYEETPVYCKKLLFLSYWRKYRIKLCNFRSKKSCKIKIFDKKNAILFKFFCSNHHSPCSTCTCIHTHIYKFYKDSKWTYEIILPENCVFFRNLCPDAPLLMFVITNHHKRLKNLILCEMCQKKSVQRFLHFFFVDFYQIFTWFFISTLTFAFYYITFTAVLKLIFSITSFFFACVCVCVCLCV